MFRPICVDLDGTLILTDSLHESVLVLLKKNPFMLLYAFFVLIFQGKCQFKSFIASCVKLNPESLPYNNQLIDFLKKEKKLGRKIILVTAAHEIIAKSIADFLGFFDEVFSTKENNFKGESKAKLLNELFGQNQYDYVGNSADDLKVWKNAWKCTVVSSSRTLLKKVEVLNKSYTVLHNNKLTTKQFLKMIRVHQYVKNLLLFVPLILTQKFLEISAIEKTFIGFLSFCFLASSVYLLNDLLDLSSDREHKTKSKRALACGKVTISQGFFLAILFFSIALLLAVMLPSDFSLVLSGYYLLTIAYSFYFKKIVLVDVCMLSALYTVRIIAGIVLLHTVYSEWIIEFSVFLFLSLAFVKRYTELKIKKDEGQLKAMGRGYHIEHLNLILIFGVVSGYIAALVMALYLNSPQALVYYATPQFLWIICPLLVYWISRTWLLANDGLMHDDPIVFALKDKASYIVSLFILASGILAKFF